MAQNRNGHDEPASSTARTREDSTSDRSDCCSSFYYESKEYPKYLLSAINVHRFERKFCDVFLQAPESASYDYCCDKVNNKRKLSENGEGGTMKTFPAHKVILSAASPYFRAMFTCGMKESCKQTIPLQSISAQCLEKILGFIYTAELDIAQYDICQLLPAATMLQVQPVIDACCCYMENQMDPSNCIEIAEFSKLHGCFDLEKKAKEYFLNHFCQVVEQEECFLSMPFDWLKSLIACDELNVQCESQVFNAVLKWIRHEPERRKFLPELIAVVRCQYLTPKFIQELLSNCDELNSQEHSDCRTHLTAIFQDLTLHNRCRNAPRRRKPCAPMVLYCVGGYHIRSSVVNVEFYCPLARRWIACRPLPSPRSGIGVVSCHSIIYTIGGRNNSERVPPQETEETRVEYYDPSCNQWLPCRSLNNGRNRPAVAALDGLVYVMGGACGSTPLNSVERYYIERDEWENVAPMNTARIGAAAAVVNRLLYAIGGFDGDQRLKLVERFNPEKNDWTVVAPMQVGRSGASAAAFDEFIVVCGGYDGTSQLSSVEKYDPETNQWTMVAPMCVARSALSCAVLDQKLFAAGGFDGQNFLSVVEVYEPEKDAWHDDQAMRLEVGRSGHGIVAGMMPCPRSL